jgi:hypothetical protein
LARLSYKESKGSHPDNVELAEHIADGEKCAMKVDSPTLARLYIALISSKIGRQILWQWVLFDP